MTYTEKTAILAEFMGWHKTSSTVFVDSIDRQIEVWADSENKEITPCVLFNPTTSIEDAMRVVEKLREKGYTVEIGDNHTKASWYCVFQIHVKQGGYDNFEGYGGTPEEAICEAALRVIDG